MLKCMRFISLWVLLGLVNIFIIIIAEVYLLAIKSELSISFGDHESSYIAVALGRRLAILLRETEYI